MSPSPRIVALAAAALLVACGPAPASSDAPGEAAPPATESPADADAAPPAAATVQTAAPAPQAAYDWYSRINDEERSRSMVLAYEVPETDDQPFNLTCEEGGERIFAGVPGADPAVQSIRLESSTGSKTFPVKTSEADELNGGRYLTVEIPGGDTVLEGFRQTGWLRVTAGAINHAMTAHPDRGAPQSIARFMAFCNG